uniref:Uncharacterized protein n=1 Tax=Solanum lycopersicum TaxID=4081 RepID=A0A3Q7H2R8_SOLLC
MTGTGYLMTSSDGKCSSIWYISIHASLRWLAYLAFSRHLNQIKQPPLNSSMIRTLKHPFVVWLQRMVLPGSSRVGEKLTNIDSEKKQQALSMAHSNTCCLDGSRSIIQVILGKIFLVFDFRIFIFAYSYPLCDIVRDMAMLALSTSALCSGSHLKLRGLKLLRIVADKLQTGERPDVSINICQPWNACRLEREYSKHNFATEIFYNGFEHTFVA